MEKIEGGQRVKGVEDLASTEENPLVTIITPAYNSEKYLEKTILSIINQDYKNIEYIIIDGGSTDKTLEIISEYDSQINYWISEKDKGIYDALNKGFDVSHGSIMAWLNSDDMYMPWAVSIMARVFKDKSISWCTGVPAAFDQNSHMVGLAFITPIYLRSFVEKGYYHGKGLGFIQQESTFWRRSLWEQIGGNLRTDLKYAGDFYLWKEFAKYADLCTVQTVIAGFRQHGAQLTSNLGLYYKDIDDCVTIPAVILGKLRANILISILNYRKAIKV